MTTDFRVIYQLSVDDIGTKISEVEAFYLLLSLMNKPESMIAVRKHGWVRTWTYEEKALIDNINLHIGLNTPKEKQAKLIPYDFIKGQDSTKIIGQKSVPLEQAQKLYTNKRKDYTAEEAAALNKVFLEEQRMKYNGG